MVSLKYNFVFGLYHNFEAGSKTNLPRRTGEDPEEGAEAGDPGERLGDIALEEGTTSFDGEIPPLRKMTSSSFGNFDGIGWPARTICTI